MMSRSEFFHFGRIFSQKVKSAFLLFIALNLFFLSACNESTVGSLRYTNQPSNPPSPIATPTPSPGPGGGSGYPTGTAKLFDYANGELVFIDGFSIQGEISPARETVTTSAGYTLEGVFYE